MKIHQSINSQKSRILLRILLILITSLTHVGATTCTDALLQSGYPTCVNNCASICEVFCPDVSNTTCECTTPAYTKSIFDCIRGNCNASDYNLTENLAIIGCSALGINVAPQISAMDASVSATAAKTTAAQFSTSRAAGGGGNAYATATGTAAPETYYPSGEQSKPTFTTTEIVGIIIGGLTALSLIGSVFWFIWAIQRRKAHANPNRGRSVVTMASPPHQPPPEQTPKPQPVVQYIPQPSSDMYPTAVIQAQGDIYPTVVSNGQQLYQQLPMQYQQVPVSQPAVSPLQQHPLYNPFPATELPNSHRSSELPSSYQAAELPHIAPQPHVELPAGFDKS
jgi:hypothetical protein